MSSPTPDAKSVFGRAAEIPSPAERAAFLDQACANYPAVRAEVEALLKALGAAGSFMGSPAVPDDQTGAYESPISEGEGTVIGPYTLREQIGEGGMGLVFVAEQSQPVRRKVALKVIKPGMDTRQVVARFEAERQALALMDHPHIAKVLDAGTTDAGRPYFVMELVRGVAITEYADANNLTPKDRLALFVQVCQAIQHAHQKGVIHRDLKPSNILVAPHDGIPVVKVIDFGVAKAVGQSLTEKTIYTRFAQMIGTPLYMSPEQAEVNQLDVDTRSDVYSLGVLLYELLTGTTPFDSDRFRKAAFDEVRRIIREEEPPRPSTRLTSLGATLTSVSARRGTDPTRLAGLVRGELDWIVMKCLEKDRTRRYDGAAALAKDVQRYLAGDAVEACPPTLGYRLRKLYRRNRAAVLVGGTFAMLLTTGIAASTLLALQAQRAEREATANAEDARRAQREADEQRTAAVGAAERFRRAERLQNLTRYAAEMNLLQVAFEGADLPRVGQLLVAQKPKTGEDDLRGPEWHYWNRRLNAHASELRVPCRVDLSFENVMATPRAQLSPNGQAMALCFAEDDGRVLLQLWDVARGTCTATRTVIPPGKWVGTLFLNSFSPDGKRITVTHLRRQFPKEDDGKTDLYCVELETGQVARLPAYEDDRIPDVRLTADRVYNHQQAIDPATGRTRVEFRRTSDGGPAGEMVIPDAAGGVGQVLFGPEPDHALVVVFPDVFNPRAWKTQRTRIAYWKVGDEKPLWQADAADAGTIVHQFQFTADGKAVGWMTLVGDTWRFRLYDLATGLPASGHPGGGYPIMRNRDLTSASPFGLRSASGHPFPFALSPDARRIAIPTPTGCAVYDLGDTRRERFGFTQGGGPPSEGLTRHHSFDSPEGPPQQLAFQSNNRLAVRYDPGLGRPSGELRERQADPNAIVRVLEVPGYATGGAASTHVLGRWRRNRAATPAAGPNELFAFQSRPIRTVQQITDGLDGSRLTVLDENSELVYQSAEGVSLHMLYFSGDGRYVYGLDAIRRDGTSLAAYSVVVWDLVEKRERLRLTPPAGQRYGLPNMTLDGARIVINVFAEPGAGDQPDGPEFVPGQVGRNSMRLVRGRVFDIASGRLLFELKPPQGVTVDTFLVGEDAIRGWIKSPGNAKPVSASAEVARWDLRTGAYLGRSAPPVPTPQDPVRVRWVERGGVAIKDYLVPEEGKPAASSSIRKLEGWDAHHRDDAARPLWSLTLENGVSFDLSPDGSRLLLRGSTDARFARMYCTTTGRELLRLPEPTGRFTPAYVGAFGLWDRNGLLYWYGVDGDGKPVGWDFRPVPGPKK